MRQALVARDIRQLWRRLVFNLLVTNVDDHLQNLGFLHTAHGRWRLAPAFAVNPFPDKEREFKTWPSENDGPITDIAMLLVRCAEFALDQQQALAVLAQVHAAVSDWRTLARSPAVGLRASELATLHPHSNMTRWMPPSWHSVDISHRQSPPITVIPARRSADHLAPAMHADSSSTSVITKHAQRTARAHSCAMNVLKLHTRPRTHLEFNDFPFFPSSGRPIACNPRYSL